MARHPSREQLIDYLMLKVSHQPQGPQRILQDTLQQEVTDGVSVMKCLSAGGKSALSIKYEDSVSSWSVCLTRQVRELKPLKKKKYGDLGP